MYGLMRNVLFCLPEERSHQLALRGLDVAACLRLGGLIGGTRAEAGVPVEVMGLRFPNALGLAAGLDKNADHIAGLAALGFGFIEIGTVTPRPQAGNALPRLFRLPGERAIINRMGFNNKGIDHALERIVASRYQGILGINIGKNADTPVENAVDDYLIGLRKAWPHAGYVVVNLSSPNTPGLRSLQYGDELRRLLDALCRTAQELRAGDGRHVPLVVKIAPDLTDEEIGLIAGTLREFPIDGVTATNTTLSRVGVEQNPRHAEAGGLSGAPLRERATEVIGKLHEALAGALPIIGVGGIGSLADARDKLAAGASLVQIYSGFIYEGPALVKEIVTGLRPEDLRDGGQAR